MIRRNIFEYLKTTLFLALLITSFSFSGCKNDDGGTDPTTIRLQELAGTWTLGTVQNDGNDVTGQFTGFQLTLNTNQSFTTESGGNSWPATGTFDFVAEDLDRMLRDDGVEVVINSISANGIELSFTQSTLGGRKAGITGAFTFSLVK